MTELSLGRSIGDLLEENKIRLNDNEEILEIDLAKIHPNPDQPRTVFDDNSLRELAQSIVEHGVIQPVIVKQVQDGYILVAGERRVRASKIAGKTTVPAVVRDYNAIYLSELALLENLQREDLSPVEEAIAFKKMLSINSMTHEELGKRIGKSRTYITNILGLLKLPAIIIEDIYAKRLTMGHARALSKITDVLTVMKLRDRIIKENLSVRDLEKIIREINRKVGDEISIDKMKNVEKQLKDIVGSNIKFKLGKSQLVLKFKSEEELEKILEFLRRG
jgi:ParB family chromosome partitioning protein